MTIQKRANGTYGVSVYDPALGGKRWVGTARNERAARRMESDAIAAGQGRGRVPTLREWAERWVDECPRPKESSNKTNLERARAVAKQPFARLQLDAIQPSDVNEWAKKHPSAHAAARAMYADAIRMGLVKGANPFASLRVKRGTGRKHVMPPDLHVLDELTEKARALSGQNFHAMLLTGAWTGMRPGELFALRPGDVNLATREIRVERQFVTKTSQEGEVKNARPRTVVVLEPAIGALATALAQAGDLLFTTPRGKRWTQGTLHYWWNPVRSAAGQPKLDWYTATRHFHGAHLLNVLRLHAQDVAAQLGHTDGGRLVMELYGHPSELLARDRIKQAQTALGSTGAPVRPVSVANG